MVSSNTYCKCLLRCLRCLMIRMTCVNYVAQQPHIHFSSTGHVRGRLRFSQRSISNIVRSTSTMSETRRHRLQPARAIAEQQDDYDSDEPLTDVESPFPPPPSTPPSSRPPAHLPKRTRTHSVVSGSLALSPTDASRSAEDLNGTSSWLASVGRQQTTVAETASILPPDFLQLVGEYVRNQSGSCMCVWFVMTS
jgi:hypothetical protein